MTLATAILALSLAASQPGAQAPLDVEELAAYRLTPAVFTRFVEASRLVAAVVDRDPQLTRTPLFTHDVLVAGDAATVAAELEARLRGHPALADALRSAQLTPREYTTFILALAAARLAHGFLESGAMRRVPQGVASDNVAFVAAHRSEVAAVLRTLGIGDPPG